jgi:hypothetical protein
MNVRAIGVALAGVLAWGPAHAGPFAGDEYYGAVLRDIHESSPTATAVQPGVGDAYGGMGMASRGQATEERWRGGNPEIDASVLYDVGHNL